LLVHASLGQSKSLGKFRSCEQKGGTIELVSLWLEVKEENRIDRGAASIAAITLRRDVRTMASRVPMQCAIIAQDAQDQSMHILTRVVRLLDGDVELAANANRRRGDDGWKRLEQGAVFVAKHLNAIVEIVQLSALRKAPSLSAR
jgi:hypothetical protein